MRLQIDPSKFKVLAQGQGIGVICVIGAVVGSAANDADYWEGQ